MNVFKDLEDIEGIKQSLNRSIDNILDVYGDHEKERPLCEKLLKHLMELQKETDDLEKHFQKFC